MMSLVIFLPSVFALVLLFFPRGKEEYMRWFALLGTAATLVLSIFMFIRWPVVGGGNYISQYFHYGHWAIDIAADYGSEVRAAAGGTVIFAGWKDNGGGYQVWIAHGSDLYTTYNHMSAITVGRGESVGRGVQVGRIGQSGNASGPHLHFEVWQGAVWNGGTRVNPLGYL